MKLTARTTATGVTSNNTFIHIVNTNDTSQDPAGSSYKAPLSLLSPLFTGATTDSYTDNATLVGNTLQFDNNIYGANFYNVDLSAIAGGGSFTGNTSGDCISELHVVRLYGCPDLNIMDNVIIDGSLSVSGPTTIQGVTIDFTGGTQGNVLTIDSGGNAVWEEPCCSGSTGGTFTGNTLATCITDLYVSNVYGCSPITVHNSVQHSGSTASGELAFAIGGLTQAIGDFSNAEGVITIASGITSHAEGWSTSAKNTADHAEGYLTIADSSIGAGGPDPRASHAEGNSTKAYGTGSHAEGNQTIAWGSSSHAEGILTIASGWTSHAEGWSTVANGVGSHVEGTGSTVNGDFSHASGIGNTVDGDYAKASGGLNSVTGDYGYAHGFGNEADTFETAFGAYNDRTVGGGVNLFTIGNGSGVGASRSNAFRVDFNGNTFNASGSYLAGADYAEYFESVEGNEIPVGTVVELVGRKIKLCENPENAIGVISANPGVIGNSDGGTSNEWVGKYEKDEWGTTLYESHELNLPSKVGEEGNLTTKKHRLKRRKLSKEFDADKEYLTREERPEWNKVALLGQVRILNKQEIPNKWIKMEDINENIGLYLIR